MKPSIKSKTTRRLQRWSTAGRTLPLLIPLMLGCFALSPAVRASCHDGCDSGVQNTFLGEEALAHNGMGLVTGSTAIGDHALYYTADNIDFSWRNTAVGASAMYVPPGPDNTAVGYQALYAGGSAQETAVGSMALAGAHTLGSNTAIGYKAMSHDGIGAYNTAIGAEAMENSQAVASYNTAIGDYALENSTGDNNTATGYTALELNTSGQSNTAIGMSALYNNVDGSENTADGYQALMNNVDGINNVATGAYALLNNNADENTADGFQALMNNVGGGSNTATGGGALTNNTAGSFNTANGAQALNRNTTGASNVAEGSFALFSNTMGNSNVAVGFDALFNTTGGSNIGVGLSAGADLTTGDNNIDIGNRGAAGESNTIRIGTSGTQTNAYMAGINGTNVPRGLSVVVDFTGHLGTKGSSERFKDGIKPMDKASEAILALKPITFRYKKELDPDGTPQFGLVAEQVEKVNPDLVARDDQGKPYTVRYEAINAMLLNEFLKEHKKVEEQQATVAQLKSTVAHQEKRFAEQDAQIQALTSGLEKVNERLEIRRTPRVVVNDP